MENANPQHQQSLAVKIAELTRMLREEDEDKANVLLEGGQMQQLIECLIKIYAKAVEMHQSDPDGNEDTLIPIPEETSLSDTEAAIFIDHLLCVKNIEIFELQMWRTLGARF